MALLARNNALYTNPPGAAEQLSTNGSSWLFAVAAIFGVSLLALLLLSLRPHSNERIFHHLLTIPTFAALLTYYAAASDLAWSPITQSTAVGHSGPTRQIFWAKYVLWSVAFPAFSTILDLLSGVSWATIVYHVALAWVWVLSLLVAAYTPTVYKWGFFGFGIVAELVLAFSTLVQGTSAATRAGVVRGHYVLLAGAVNFLWVLYPLAWGLTDGGNYLGVTPSFIWFGILDLLLVVGVGYAVVGLSAKWDYGRLGISFTQHGRVAEKETAVPANGAGETTV